MKKKNTNDKLARSILISRPHKHITYILLERRMLRTLSLNTYFLIE